MNIEEKYLEKIWARINNGDDDRLMLSWDEQFDITDILKEYHAEQLALCNVSCSLPEQKDFISSMKKDIETMHFNYTTKEKLLIRLGANYAYLKIHKHINK